MEYNDLEKALSKPRIGKFLIAVSNDKKRAEIIYRLNIELSKSIYGVLSIFEVTLRNCIDMYYQNLLNDKDWLRNQCGQRGIFSHPSFQKYGFEPRTKILTTIAKLGKWYTHDRLVAELNFGFWVYMFAPLQFLVGGQGLHKIFLNRPKGTNQKTIFKELDQIRITRNRIAHHEPLCFNNTGLISTDHTKRTFDLIGKHTHWLGFEPNSLYNKPFSIDEIIASFDKEK